MNPMILIVLLFSLVLPLVLLILWRKKTGAKLWCFAAGALCFFLFANILEGLLHQACLITDGPVSRAIMGSPVLYTLYAAFAAGIFEETGRLFGFKVLLRHRTEKETAVAYGIGHGGIEIILTLTVTYLLYLLASLGVSIGDAATTAQYAAFAGGISAKMALLAMLERCSAMMLHIGLSLLMFIACRGNKKMWLYPVSILLHALADVVPALFQFGVLTSLVAVEGIIFVFGAAVLLLAYRVFRAFTAENVPDAEPAEV